MLSNPVSLQTEWQKSRPESSDLQDYRDWILQWSVLLKRLGGVPPDIAKTQYLHALLSCGFFDSQLEKLYELQDTQPKALTLEDCHNFIMPLLRTHRRFTVSKKAAGRKTTETHSDEAPVQGIHPDSRGRTRGDEANRRGQSPEREHGGGKRTASDRGLPPCTYCGKAHNPKTCWVGSSTHWPPWLKNQKRVGESDVKERLRLSLCVWCGKRRHEGKEKCPERKPRTSPQAEGESKSADRPMCKGCGKEHGKGHGKGCSPLRRPALGEKRSTPCKQDHHLRGRVATRKSGNTPWYCCLPACVSCVEFDFLKRNVLIFGFQKVFKGTEKRQGFLAKEKRTKGKTNTSSADSRTAQPTSTAPQGSTAPQDTAQGEGHHRTTHSTARHHDTPEQHHHTAERPGRHHNAQGHATARGTNNSADHTGAARQAAGGESKHKQHRKTTAEHDSTAPQANKANNAQRRGPGHPGPETRESRRQRGRTGEEEEGWHSARVEGMARES